jgi:replicative DNA helicase
MAKCVTCNRDLPLSGKCPFCAGKPVLSGGFSLSKLLKKTDDTGEAQPAPVSPARMPPSVSPMTDFADLPQDSVVPPPPSLVAPASPPPAVAESRIPVANPVEEQVKEPISPAQPSILSQLRGKPSSPVTGSSVPPSRPRPGEANSEPIPSGKKEAFSSLMETNKKPIITADSPSGQQAVFASQVTGFGDDEMECAVLAGLITDHFILESATSRGLIAELFSTKYSRAICKAILSLREDNRDGSLIDKIILKNKLKQQGLFDVPMQNFLNRVMAQPVPTMDQVLYYIDLLKEQALKRKLKEVSERINAFIEKPQTENLALESFTSQLIEEVRNVQKAKNTKRIQLVKEEMRDIIRDIDQREINGEVEIIGYSFEPFHYLNVAISGFRKGFMYAIAGAPRRGKTTFTLELATAVATNCKIPVLFFTYEQTKKNLTYRLLAKESRLNPDSLQRKKVRSDMIMDAKFMGGWKRMQAYMDYFYIIEATKTETIDRIRAYAYNVMQDFDTENIMIFVDYIQKMPLSRTYMDEKFKVEEISTELKALSIELNNPIMTISSLSKEGCMIDATESAERPTMYHCKGSGDLEYDLDCAMIQAKDWGDTKELFQQLQHKAEEKGKDPTRVPRVDVVNLYLDKNRDAPEGIFSTMQYLFFIEDNKFIELGPKYDDDRFRFSKIEALVEDLIEKNYIIFHETHRENAQQKGRVQIKLKNF